MTELAEAIGLTLVLERDAGGNPLLSEDEALLQSFERVRLVLGADADQGQGKLFVLGRRVVWLSADAPATGFAAEFLDISMHAVSSDPESFSQPCLYVQLDAGGDGYDEDEDEGAPLPELRLVPADPAQLEAIFKAFCDGAERNPDADAGGGGGDGGPGQAELYFDRDEVLAGATGAALSTLDADEDAALGDGRFEDADAEEGEGEDGFEEFEGEQGPNGKHAG